MLVMYLINCVFTFLLGFSCAGFISRTAFRLAVSRILLQEKKLNELKNHLNDHRRIMKGLLFELSHIMTAPLKTFRGLRNILLPHAKEINDTLIIAERVNHQHYAGYARNKFNGIMDLVEAMNTTALKAETQLTESVDKINDLYEEI